MKQFKYMKQITILKNSPFKPHIRPSMRLIRPKLKEKLQSVKYIPHPKKPMDELTRLKQIAKKFKIILITFSTINGVDGMTYPLERSIEISLMDYSMTKIRTIFCHELAHIFQFDTECWIPENDYNMSEALMIEQEAESAAVVLYKKLFPEYKFDSDDFNTYFTEEDIIRLKEWLELNDNHFKSNDLFILNEK